MTDSRESTVYHCRQQRDEMIAIIQPAPGDRCPRSSESQLVDNSEMCGKLINLLLLLLSTKTGQRQWVSPSLQLCLAIIFPQQRPDRPLYRSPRQWSLFPSSPTPIAATGRSVCIRSSHLLLTLCTLYGSC